MNFCCIIAETQPYERCLVKLWLCYPVKSKVYTIRVCDKYKICNLYSSRDRGLFFFGSSIWSHLLIKHTFLVLKNVFVCLYSFNDYKCFQPLSFSLTEHLKHPGQTTSMNLVGHSTKLKTPTSNQLYIITTPLRATKKRRIR